MPTNLLNISSGVLSSSNLANATATTGDVLSGKTFYSGNEDLKTGTMTNRGAWTSSVAAGESVTIPAGYHNGSGKVTASKGSLHRKTISFWSGANSGSKTYNVVSSFGIPSNIASGLSTDNFVARTDTLNWTRDDSGANNISVHISITYSASSKVLTLTYQANYTETIYGAIYVDAFWVS